MPRSSVKRSPRLLISSAPAANRSGERASAVVTKLITNGRSDSLGMCSSDQAIRFAKTRQGGNMSSTLRHFVCDAHANVAHRGPWQHSNLHPIGDQLVLFTGLMLECINRVVRF
jgi:hypothetical protein